MWASRNKMVKAREIQKWYKDHISDGKKPFCLDKYQARIIADQHKNSLVTARAGSGKTRTLVAKIVYLIAHDKIPPEEIIVFTFNKKARKEVNDRLAMMTYDGEPIFSTKPSVASTFHAFAYDTLGGKRKCEKEIISEAREYKIISDIIKAEFPQFEKLKPMDFRKKVETAKQFIARAEQKYFPNYDVLDELLLKKLKPTKNTTEEQLKTAQSLSNLNIVLKKYHQALERENLINFNQIVAFAAEAIKIKKLPYRYILIDEYQDFSLLFLSLTKALRHSAPAANLLCVGDDWQAINRFAGSDVEFFINFKKYFPEDCKKLFLPTNYRSGKRIVKNANYFMSRALKDFNGCKSGNKKLKSAIFYRDIDFETRHSSDLPLLLENYIRSCLHIIEDNPNKSIMILHRNNEMSFRGWTIDKFVSTLQEQATANNLITNSADTNLITGSTIHRSKGLESDIVVLLEIDAEKFPGKDKSHGLFSIFGDSEQNLFIDESRLFYVALTRPREKLYILSKTTSIPKNLRKTTKAKLNFFNYLNGDWLIDF